MAKVANEFKPATRPFGSGRGRSSNYGPVFARFNELAMDAGFEGRLELEEGEDATKAKASLRNALHRHGKMQSPSVGAAVGFEAETDDGTIPYTVYKVGAREPRPRNPNAKKPGRKPGSTTKATATASGGARRR